MAKKTIIIDGYIGPGSFSQQYVRNELNGHKNDEVIAKIASLGGSVAHALNIYDQFIEHGNITAELSSFVASSATIISLGASKIRMNENSFYLIHKTMNWVDEWGLKNEDDIEELINKLEKEKQQLAKITLQLAKIYSKKTGKTIKEITDLMKEETWLTAEEAKEWGFVDELFTPEKTVNFLDDEKMVALISANELPVPGKSKDKNNSKLKNTTAMADKKDENKFSFKSEEEMLAFMKDKFGLKPMAEKPKEEPESKEFKFESEDDARNWFQKLFGIQPKAQKTEKETPEKKEPENNASEEDVEQLKTDLQKKEGEVKALKTQIENLKNAPGAEDKKTTQETDEKKNNASEKDDTIEAYSSAKETYDAVNSIFE